MANVNVDVTATNVANPQTPMSVSLMAVCNPDGSPISAGGGGGGGAMNLTQVGGAAIALGAKPAAESLPVVLASNQAAIPVSGPVTNAQLVAVSGAVTVPAWNGTDASATLISILKALHVQNAAILVQLQAINSNTSAG